MSKIIQVINSIIEHSEKISNTEKIDNYYYFMYKEYVWSILRTDLDESGVGYYLSYYPRIKKVSDLTKLSMMERFKAECINYSTYDIKTQEAFESFAELYTIVKEKYFGVNKMFDDILGENQVAL